MDISFDTVFRVKTPCATQEGVYSIE
jgi:hypothetical protein